MSQKGEQQKEGEGDNDKEQHDREEESGGGLDIGGVCEVREASDLPLYSLTRWCNHPCDNTTPLENIMTQTNLYASQYISAHNLLPRSRVYGRAHEQFTREELQKFISFIIIMDLPNTGRPLGDNMAILQPDMLQSRCS